MPPPPERVMAGALWVKRRGGCYVRHLEGSRLRLLLLRNKLGLWTAGAQVADGRGPLVWRSTTVPTALEAAQMAQAWGLGWVRGLVR